MFGLAGLLGGGGLSANVSSSAKSGDLTQGDIGFGNIGGFGNFAVGDNARAEGSTGSSGGMNSQLLIFAVAGAGLLIAVLFLRK
jgi:hypothetical protein